MGLVDYISRNPFAKAKNVSAYNENFVVATISKIRDSFKHLIQNKRHIVQKFNRILKLHSPSYSANRLIALQIPTLIRNNPKFCIKKVALKLSHYNTLLTFASQLATKSKVINPHLNMSIAPQMPSQNLKPQFALKNLPLHKSHSINKFATNALQKSDNKEGEQSEQLDSIKPIFDTNSSNQHKFLKLGAKLQTPEYKYNQPKKPPFLTKANSEFIRLIIIR